MNNNRIGSYVKRSFHEEGYDAYIPAPLPPDPPIDLSQLHNLLDKANNAIGRLDGISRMLPDISLFIFMYIRKEAVLSSQIEGTQSSFSDLMLVQTDADPTVPMDDVAEVSSYVTAMNYGLERLKTLPLSLRLLKEIHQKLMNNFRGSNKMPGEFRTTQNWIGGSRPGNALFVPPPAETLMEHLGSLENFLHDDSIPLPILVKIAIAHVQFETIHPFLDGNGRLGRLLITFILCNEGLLEQPLLYLSLYLKTHRSEYYQHLQDVRTKGAWEEWIAFFLQGVIETAKQATDIPQRVLKLFDSDKQYIEQSGKSSAALLVIYDLFKKHPMITTQKISKLCDYSHQTVLRALFILEELGIIYEITGKSRHKIFSYKKYLEILDEATYL